MPIAPTMRAPTMSVRIALPPVAEMLTPPVVVPELITAASPPLSVDAKMPIPPGPFAALLPEFIAVALPPFCVSAKMPIPPDPFAALLPELFAVAVPPPFVTASMPIPLGPFAALVPELLAVALPTVAVTATMPIPLITFAALTPELLAVASPLMPVLASMPTPRAPFAALLPELLAVASPPRCPTEGAVRGVAAEIAGRGIAAAGRLRLKAFGGSGISHRVVLVGTRGSVSEKSPGIALGVAGIGAGAVSWRGRADKLRRCRRRNQRQGCQDDGVRTQTRHW